MTFLYPLGLLGLIGVPILLLIYFIKSRYTEHTIASTYLWTLSNRFLKRKSHFSGITGIISLILQILLVVALSLAIAHPVITLPGAAREYCFIIDGSGSMQTEIDGVTRFDEAKEEVISIINDSKDGSVFSLVVVGSNTEIVFELNDDKKQAIELLEDVKCSDGEISYADAIAVAQRYFNENPSALTYLITDTEYAETQNVEVINVSSKETNFALRDLTYNYGDGGKVIVNGRVDVFGEGRPIGIAVFVDGSEAPAAEQKLQSLPKEGAQLSFELDIESFDLLEIRILDGDANPLDNTHKLYNLKSENSYDALLVSDTPFFFESALEAVGNANVTVMSTKDYTDRVKTLSESGKKISGYGLYVFDSYTPDYMPEDGSVWLIGLEKNLEGSGYSVQGEVVVEEGFASLEMTKNSSNIIRTLTNGMLGDDVAVSRYVKCGIYSNFTTIYSYMGAPMIFTGLNEFSNREVVFSFSLHDSDFALSPDYAILISNLLEYSFPSVIEKTNYFCGDTAGINVVSGCESIRVTTPGGEVFYADTSKAISEFKLTEVGEYKIIADVSGNEREFTLYSSLPKEESDISPSDGSFKLMGEATDGGRDGKYDELVVYFIAAALLFSAEWVVYCYDKYQLR